MRRREFMRLLGGATAWPIAARAQRQSMPTIGFLASGSPIGRANFVAAFRRGLRELGFIEGTNIAIEYAWADDRYERLPELAADLVRRQVSVIAAIGTSAPGLAAKAATSAIPIVFQTGGDPVKEGLVDRMERPSGNITGTAIFATGLEGKRLQLLHEVVAKPAMIAVLLNRDSIAAATQVQDIEAAAKALGRDVRILHVNTESAVEAVLTDAVAKKASGLLVTSDIVFNTWYQTVVTLTNSHRLPAIYPQRLHAAAGGLMSYGTNLADAYRQTGVYVGRILKGEKIADLPVLQSIKFEFIINLKTAAALDITIPPGVLSIADEVVE